MSLPMEKYSPLDFDKAFPHILHQHRVHILSASQEISVENFHFEKKTCPSIKACYCALKMSQFVALVTFLLYKVIALYSP